MKRVLAVVVILVAAWYGGGRSWLHQYSAPGVDTSSTGVAAAFTNHQSNIEVRGVGRVIRILPDDERGSRHQRFIIRVSSGQTILIAHNIDLAERVGSLKPGDSVEFYGEYEWNAKGGTIHWTHHDPSGRHVSGWLKHSGYTYQ